jgi:glycine hydroxymethyltransferase
LHEKRITPRLKDSLKITDYSLLYYYFASFLTSSISCYYIYMDLSSTLNQSDPEINALLNKEVKRQQENIELIASENIVSQAVMDVVGSCLTNKYAEGYPHKRYYNGCEHHDRIEDLAIERLCKLYNCNFANVQPHSGANANLAVFLALLNPGDKFLGMSLKEGGHLTHGATVNVSGKWFQALSYGVDENGFLDYSAIEKIAIEEKPKLIIAGASAYPRVIDFGKFRAIADRCGALLMVDMAHISGLVAGGVHPSPFPHADVVTSTTHKTLRGPRGGIILWNNEEFTKLINSAIFPGTQGGPLMHVIAGKAVAFKEALEPDFKLYQEQIIKNCKAMAETFTEHGIDMVSGGTDNHLLLLDLRKFKLTGKNLANLLDELKITVNKNGVPNDPESPFTTSGIRVGTATITTRGFKEKESKQVAELISTVIKEMAQDGLSISESSKNQVHKGVKALTEQFPVFFSALRIR